MDLQTLQTRCRTRFRDPNQHVYVNDDWTGYLNDALADVQAASPFWPWMESRASNVSVTANARSGNLPTGAIRVTAVLNTTDHIPLTQLDGNAEQNKVFPNMAAEPGTPTLYRVRGRTIELYPVTDHAVTLEVEYLVGADEMDSDTDEPPFQEHYHRILVEGALARAYVDDGAPDQAAIHQGRFDALLEELKVAELTPRTDRFPVIPDTWYS